MAPVTSPAAENHVVDHTAQLIATILTSAITVAAVLAVLAFCRRRGVVWPVFVLVSGLATFLCEPLFDHLYGLWFWHDGQWTAVTTYGIHVPVWLPVVYVTYYGAWTIWLVQRWERGATALEVARLFAVSALIAGLFETLYIQIFGLYVYQDSQPLSVSDYPVWVAVVNGLPPFLASIIYTRLIPITRGWGRLALLYVVPFAFVAEFGTGWLYLAARHSGEHPSMPLLTVLAVADAASCFGLVVYAAKLAGIDRRGTAAGAVEQSPVDEREPVPA